MAAVAKSIFLFGPLSFCWKYFSPICVTLGLPVEPLVCRINRGSSASIHSGSHSSGMSLMASSHRTSQAASHGVWGAQDSTCDSCICLGHHSAGTRTDITVSQTCSLLHAAPLFVFSAGCLTTRHLVTLDEPLRGNRQVTLTSQRLHCVRHFSLWSVFFRSSCSRLILLVVHLKNLLESNRCQWSLRHQQLSILGYLSSA